jgi:hypothetical protein
MTTEASQLRVPTEVRRHICRGLEEDIKSINSLLERADNPRRLRLVTRGVQRIKVSYEFYKSHFIPDDELETLIDALNKSYEQSINRNS